MTPAVRNLRVTIDARFLGPRLTGLGRYVGALVEELEGIDDGAEYTILLRSSNWDDYVPRRRNFRRSLADVPWYTVSEQLRMPRILARTRPDLVHFPNFNIPLAYTGPFVLTIHDLIKSEMGPAAALAGRSPGTLLKYQVYKRIVQAAAQRARLVLVPAEAVRETLVDLVGISDQKIIVTPEAAHSVFLRELDTADQDAVLGRYGIREPYILYVGNAYPYKNLESVIDALPLVPEPLYFVNPCSRDVFYPRLRRHALEKGVSERLILPGFVPDDDLAVLYRRARAYVFPSLAEGFGIPALEAMASGLPVACSDIPVLREVCGDAAIYFEPKNPLDIASAIRRLTSDEQMRRSLASAGRRRSAAFTWRRTAELTQAAYHQAASLGGAAPH